MFTMSICHDPEHMNYSSSIKQQRSAKAQRPRIEVHIAQLQMFGSRKPLSSATEMQVKNTENLAFSFQDSTNENK